MDKLIKLETHLHTCEVSGCGMVHADEMMRLHHAAGYYAVVVTDHFLPGSFENRAARASFLTGFRLARAAGEALGMTVLPGMEIRFASGPEDFLVYGLTEESILSLPDDVCDRGVTAFHARCRQNGWLLYQAHPFRAGLRVMPAGDLDGIETRNCNPRHNSHNDLAKAYADTYGLLTLCGSDAHQVEDVGAGGILAPQDVLTPTGLVDYLRSTREPSFL